MKKQKMSYQKALSGLRKCVLSTIDSCEEALSDTWDRSDDGFIAMRDDLAYWMAELKASKKPVVHISVEGGVAYIDKCPRGIEVEIKDYDNEGR